MKRLLVVLSVIASLFIGAPSHAFDRDGISKNVDEVVEAINGGKSAASFAPDAYVPYAFIMDEKGVLVVHPTLAGQDLKVKAMPIYEALQKATPDGVWVSYEWKGKEKNTYARLTKNNLLVASGY